MFTIQMLGTSSGVPTKTRNVSGTALTLPNSKEWVLIDCGEGTQHQILHCNLSLTTLKAIFITHVHGDHCYGLPGLIASASMAGRSDPLIIVAPKEIEMLYNAVKSATQLYTPFDVRFLETEQMSAMELNNTTVTAVKLSHRVPSHAFCFNGVKTVKKLLTDKLDKAGIPRGPLWGKLQSGEDIEIENGERIRWADFVDIIETKRKVVVAGDNDTPNLLGPAAENADVLVHEATYTEELLLKVGEHPQHSSAKRVAAFAESVGIPNLLLTHFSARFQRSNGSDGMEPIALEARDCYQGNLFLANDLDKYELNDSGIFRKTQ